MNIASRGASMAVDWEQRVDFPRLRRERLERARAALAASDLGALLLFDPNNIRYVTSTHIGEWARDKNARFVLLCRDADPILWDFGSAARHHQLYAPWLPETSWRAGVTSMRGAMPRRDGRARTRWRRRSSHELRERGLEAEPLGIDMSDMVTLEALHRAGIHTTDAQRVMLAARKIKTEDEKALLGSRGRDRRRRLRAHLRAAAPGRARARDRRRRDALPVRAGLRAGRGHQRRLRRPLQPAPARLLRPADQAGRPGLLRHHPLVHGLPDVLLPHVLRRQRLAVSGRRLQAVPPVARRRDRARPPGRDDRPDRRGLADRRGAGLPERGVVLRPPVRPRARRRALRGRR